MNKVNTIKAHLGLIASLDAEFSEDLKKIIAHATIIGWLNVNFLHIKVGAVTYGDYRKMCKMLGVWDFAQKFFDALREEEAENTVWHDKTQGVDFNKPFLIEIY